MISSICDFVSVCACPRSRRKITRAINAKLGTQSFLGPRGTSTCVDLKVKKLKVKGQGHTVMKCVSGVDTQVDI